MDTIRSVGTGYTVRISTMDWLGQSQFTEQTVYWSSLSSAISEVLLSIICCIYGFYCLFASVFLFKLMLELYEAWKIILFADNTT